MYFILILVVSSFLAVFAWNCANDVLALSKPDLPVSVTIAEDYTVSELSRNLKELGVIENSWLFTLYCNFSEAEKKIEPGTFAVNANLDYHALVGKFRNVTERKPVQVKVTEGKTLKETLRLIADQGVSKYETLLAAVGTAELDYPFLADIPMEPNRLEGYLYPDTYLFFTDASPAEVFQKFLDNFDVKLTNSMRSYLSEIDYDLNGILTIASLIQMEAASDSEMKNISSVIYNRLNSSNYRRLEIDASIVYLIGRENGEITPEEIYAGRTEIDSPYNTFQYEGLPPGPICSPSIEAIRAALYPGTENYYYYALSKDGDHHFFETQAGFERFINSDDFINN
ncbi:MAG: endolytic transglycosylase MltG [Oscillospiraceae bacterium]|nr:endolytic transglycosylase MltG [Oscillospiraceae bacterium]